MPARRIYAVKTVEDGCPTMNMAGYAAACGQSRDWVVKWSARLELPAYTMNEAGSAWVPLTAENRSHRQPVFFCRLATEEPQEEIEVPSYNVRGASAFLEKHPVAVRALVERGQLDAYTMNEAGSAWVKTEPDRPQRDLFFLQRDLEEYARYAGVGEYATQLYRVPEAARLLGFTRAYVWKLIKAGEIQTEDLTRPGLRRSEGIRVPAAEVERLKVKYAKS